MASNISQAASASASASAHHSFTYSPGVGVGAGAGVSGLAGGGIYSRDHSRENVSVSGLSVSGLTAPPRDPPPVHAQRPEEREASAAGGGAAGGEGGAGGVGGMGGAGEEEAKGGEPDGAAAAADVDMDPMTALTARYASRRVGSGRVGSGRVGPRNLVPSDPRSALASSPHSVPSLLARFRYDAVLQDQDAKIRELRDGAMHGSGSGSGSAGGSRSVSPT